MQIIALFFFILLATSLFSQTTFTIEWQKNLGGTAMDQLRSMVRTTDGGFILAGTTASIDGDVSGNNGNRDYWVVKTDSAGNIQWQKCLGGSGWDEATSIKETSDGGFVVTGFIYSNDGDITCTYGSENFWVAKLSNSGSLQWQKCFGGSQSDRPNDIISTIDGGYLVAGNTFSNNGNVSGNHGESDVWVIKLAPNGNLVWQKCYGGTNSDYGTSVKQTNDGGFIFTGTTSSNNGDVTFNHGYSDVWLVKTDNSGNIQWQKTYGGTGNEGASTVILTSDGGYLFGGSTNSSDGNITNNYGQTDVWIVKTDSIGNLQWQNSFGGTSMESPSSVRETVDGGYIIAGNTFSTNGVVSGNNGGSDFWLIKLNMNGNFEWQKCLGGTNHDQAYSVVEMNQNNYLFGGYSQSIDGDVAGNIGFADFWLVKLNTVTSVEDVFTDSQILIYPNPFRDYLIVNIAKQYSKEKLSLEIYNSHGEIISYYNTGSTIADVFFLPVEHLPAGMYFLKIKTENKYYTKKIIKVN